jgi:hypothetical protein
MKSILTTLAGLFITLYPQETVLNIKSSSTEITGRMINCYYHQDKSQLKDLVNILNKDVVDYYDLRSRYDTESKRKAYSESEDYKSGYLKLEDLRSKLVSTAYYLDFEPVFNDVKSLPFRYNPDSSEFSVMNEVDFNSHFNEPGYVQFDRILFKYPLGMMVRKNNTNSDCIDLVDETISFGITGSALASKIAEDSSSFRLLFVFNLTGAIPVQGKTQDLTAEDYWLMTDLREVIPYNSKTGEIYSVYKK